jgi:guanylate kinase
MNHKIFVISGPAAVGKTTVSKLIRKKFPILQQSMTYTTREKRDGSSEDKIMRYISSVEFLKKMNRNDFIEWAHVHDNYYGTDKKFLIKTIKKGPILMNIDVQGGLQMKQQFPETVLIFLKPDSFSQLKQRLLKRQTKTENKKDFEVRLMNVKNELKLGKKYDYKIINSQGELSKTVQKISKIITKELSID